jgi:hypothetical protein
MNRVKEPLYRKENKLAIGYRGDIGGDFRHTRNTKKFKRSDNHLSGMGGNKQRGVDYTPLFRFLLSKVGEKWDAVYSEAVSRLDREDPIFWMVYTEDPVVDFHHPDQEMKESFRAGESSMYSKLMVDENGILQYVNPNLTINDFHKTCHCCTHTFNGKVINNPWINAYQNA